jgi:hypothetical protein
MQGQGQADAHYPPAPPGAEYQFAQAGAGLGQASYHFGPSVGTSVAQLDGIPPAGMTSSESGVVGGRGRGMVIPAWMSNSK